MKQIFLNVEERKYKFLVELLKNFDFVTIQKQDQAKKQSLKKIASDMQAAALASQGKLNTRSAKTFLNEL